MQIPKENPYVGLVNISDGFEELSQYYCLRKADEVMEYLSSDERRISYLVSIAPLIDKYFPENEKFLTYCRDPEFNVLDQAMVCVIGNDSLFEREHELMNRLNDEILHLDEFPVKVKSSLSVRLWWL